MKHLNSQAKTNYDAILEAASKRELWPQGKCLTPACSAEIITLEISYLKENQASKND